MSNFSKFFENLTTQEEAIEFFGEKGWNHLISMFREATDGGVTSLDGKFTKNFRVFVIGYMMGLRVGEHVGREVAVSEAMATINQVFGSLAEDLEDGVDPKMRQ